MLSKKLKLNQASELTAPDYKPNDDNVSRHFSAFWNRFYNIECLLNNELKNYTIKSSKITHYYNAIEYTSEVHCAYLEKFLNGPKKLMFIGMNPGPNGMAQTGVPFGNVKTVKDYMKLDGVILQPENIHPKRPITGLKCTREEPSGVKFWNLLIKLSTGLDILSKQCFVHNFCPLIFFDLHGHNITPSELKGEDKKEITKICRIYLQQEIELINPEIIISVGTYVNDSIKAIKILYPNITFLRLAHPSPRSLNNANWPEKAQKFFEDHNLINYLKNNI